MHNLSLFINFMAKATLLAIRKKVNLQSFHFMQKTIYIKAFPIVSSLICIDLFFSMSENT